MMSPTDGEKTGMLGLSFISFLGTWKRTGYPDILAGDELTSEMQASRKRNFGGEGIRLQEIG